MPETLTTLPALSSEGFPIPAEQVDGQLNIDDELAAQAANTVSSEGFQLNQYPNAPESNPVEAAVVEATAAVETPAEPKPAFERLESRTYNSRDWERVKKSAKEFFDFFQSDEDRRGENTRQGLISARAELKKQLEAFQEQALAAATEIDPNFSDQAAIAKAVENTKNDMVMDLVTDQFEDVEGANRKERKTTAKSRESLTKLLTMSDEQFRQVIQDWEMHDARLDHAVARKEDKGYNSKSMHVEAVKELGALDDRYGGTMAEVSAMPLDRSEGGATQHILGEYMATQAENRQKHPNMLEVVDQANVNKAVKALQESLKAGYLAQGMSEEQATRKLAEGLPALRKWIEAQDGSTNALADLEKYGLQRNKEAMWAVKRQKVREYLGPTVLKQVFGNLFRGEKAPSLVQRINLAAELNRSIDHSGGRRRAGAAAMRNSGRIGSLWGRVVTQLETARNLGRNEGTLMKSRLYITAMERGLGDSLVTAWEAIPESEKQKAREKWALGKATAAASLRKLAAKAAQKARARA